MKKIAMLVMAIALIGLFSGHAKAEEKVIFGFERDVQGWEIPEWALEQQDHVAKTLEASKDVSKEGKQSLKVDTDFPGKAWTAAIIEEAEYFDWTLYREVACDIYIPKDAPVGLKAKLILTVGESWKFTEMARSVSLVPGEWTTVTANLLPGSEDWKKTVVDDNFRKDVRKIDIRVESNKQPAYKGPIYIDNVRVIK